MKIFHYPKYLTFYLLHIPYCLSHDAAQDCLEVAFATGAGLQVAHDVEVAGAERELVVARTEKADRGHVLPAEAAPPELQEGFENRAPELLCVVAECADSQANWHSQRLII